MGTRHFLVTIVTSVIPCNYCTSSFIKVLFFYGLLKPYLYKYGKPCIVMEIKLQTESRTCNAGTMSVIALNKNEVVLQVYGAFGELKSYVKVDKLELAKALQVL